MKKLVVCVGLAACGGGGGGGAPAEPEVRGCETMTAAAFCDDFDADGQDVSPFGWASVENPSVGVVQLGAVTVDGNRSFSMTMPLASLAYGESTNVALDTSGTATLQFDTRIPSAFAFPTEIAQLNLLAADGASQPAQVGLYVQPDGTVSIIGTDGENVFTPVPTNSVLAPAAWVTYALHVTVGTSSISISLDAADEGNALGPVVGATSESLNVAVGEVSALTELAPTGSDAETSAEFDNVAMFSPTPAD
jgi:hypothetical protein